MKYPGQKNIPGVYQKIINQIPKHTVYYELFAGSAQIAKLLTVRDPKHKIYLNDIDTAVNTQLYLVPGATVTNKNALDLIQSKTIVSAGKDTFIFLDPPYSHDTRPNNTSLYNFEMSTADHEQLLMSLLKLKCNWMIIHPQNELYDITLKSCRILQIKIRYNNKTSIENLYMNYPEVNTLMDYKYLGADCWDRQRIKRKGDRLINKIFSLPVLEQNYLIERIINKSKV